MGFSLSLGGNKSKSSSSSKSTSTTTGFTELFGMDAESKAALDEVLGTLMGRVAGPTAGDPRYSKEAAISDSQALVASIFDKFQKTALPPIFSMQGKAGAYNNTSAQLMANDAFAAANTQAAGTVLDTILNYAKLSQGQQAQDTEALLNVFGLQNKAYSKEVIDQTTKTVGSSKGKQSGMAIGASVS